MAEFTSRLGDANGSHPVINTEKPLVNPTKVLAGVADTALSVLANTKERRAAEAKAAAKARADRSLDELARISFDFRTTPQGRKVSQAQSALEAGATSELKANATITAQVRSLINRFPDQAYEIFTQLDEMGIDNTLFREYNFRNKQQDAEEDLIIAANKTAYEKAINSGMDPNKFTPDQIYARGRLHLKNSYDWEEQVKLNKELRAQRTAVLAEESAARSVRSAQRAEESHRVSMIDRQIRQNNAAAVMTQIRLQSDFNVVTMSEVADLTAKAAESGLPEDIQALEEKVREAQNSLRTIRAAGIANLTSMEGMDIGSLDTFNKSMDGWENLLASSVTGDLSASAETSRVLDALAQRANMEAWQIAEDFMRLRSVVGSTGTGTIVANGLVMNDTFMNSTADGLTKFITSLEKNKRQIANGRLPTVDDLPEEEQEPMTEGYLSTKQSLQQAILGGDTSAENLETYGVVQRTLLSTVPQGVVLTPRASSNFIADTLSEADLGVIKTMRNVAPVQAASLEADLARSVDQVYDSIAMDAAENTIDSTGSREPKTHFIPGPGGELVQVQDSFVAWNDTSQTFVVSGDQMSPFMHKKASDLNRALNYMSDYNQKYLGMSPKETINLYVHQRFPGEIMSEAVSQPVNTGRIGDEKP